VLWPEPHVQQQRLLVHGHHVVLRPVRKLGIRLRHELDRRLDRPGSDKLRYHLYEGKYSLAVGFSENARVEVNPCSFAVSLVGYKLSAKVSLVGTGMPIEGCYVRLNFSSYPGQAGEPTYGDSWTEVSYAFPTSASNDESFLGGSTYCEGFTGTLYTDSVTLTK
jgi:hypothetical protein